MALGVAAKTKIITHPLHESRVQVQTNSVIEFWTVLQHAHVPNSWARGLPPRISITYVRTSLAGPPAALAGYTSQRCYIWRIMLPVFTYGWYILQRGKCGSLVGHASVGFQRTRPRIAREIRAVTGKARASARIIVLNHGAIIVIMCDQRGVICGLLWLNFVYSGKRLAPTILLKRWI